MFSNPTTQLRERHFWITRNQNVSYKITWDSYKLSCVYFTGGFISSGFINTDQNFILVWTRLLHLQRRERLNSTSDLSQLKSERSLEFENYPQIKRTSGGGGHPSEVLMSRSQDLRVGPRQSWSNTQLPYFSSSKKLSVIVTNGYRTKGEETPCSFRTWKDGELQSSSTHRKRPVTLYSPSLDSEGPPS